MKKALLILGGALLVLAFAGYIGVSYFLGDAVKAGVNKLGPQVTQSKVELGSAQLSPLTGTGTLSGLAVGNPSGWSDGRAFYLGRVHLDVAPSSIFKDTIVINELVIDQPEFNYETTLFSSNIKDLLKNVEKYTGPGEQSGGTKQAAAKKFIVKKLRFTNGKATVVVGTTSLVVPLPEIKVDDIGTAEGGVTGARVSAVVMREVLAEVASSAASALSQDGGKATLEKAKESAKQIGDAVKDLFKKKP